MGLSTSTDQLGTVRTGTVAAVLVERDGQSYADNFEDMVAFVREFGSATGELAEDVRSSRCVTCGSATFWMECSEEDGVAMRTCTQCQTAAFIGDSAELWDAADTGDAVCPCGAKVFELAIGFCVGAEPELDVEWIVVGARCTVCHLVGVYADWGIDYVPSASLKQQI